MGDWFQANVVEPYNYYLTERRDPRVDDYPLMGSPWPTLFICLAYVVLVKIIGPKMMKGRPPFELKKTLLFYNIFQIIFSAWLFYEYGRGGWFHGYNFNCQPVDYSMDAMAMRMVRVCWFYYFSKFTEFFDTFFFVLRKKSQHVSLLHVVHHGCMPMSVWFGVKFTPGGHSTFFGLLNTFVHVVMYFYYLISSMRGVPPSFKKGVTNLQMVQFVLISVHSFQLFFIQCDYPRAFVWWIGCHGVLFLVLFSNFYIQNYLKKQKRLKSGALTTEKNNNLILKSVNAMGCIILEQDSQIMNLLKNKENSETAMKKRN